jgi:hypothetical protein
MSLPVLVRELRKPLNQKGFHHYLIPLLVFVILFGIGGAYFYIVSHAAGNGIEYQLGSNKGICMDNNGGRSNTRNKVDIWGCNGSSAQAWTIQTIGSNRFLLHDAAGTCLDDIGDGGSGAHVQTYGCNSADHAQVWSWNNSQLENVYSHACVNDPGYSRSNGTQLIVYGCQGSSNEKWYEVSQGGGSTGGSGGGSSRASVASRIIAAARHWNGVWYLYGGGHESYSAFHRACPTVSTGNGACQVDCSGLVSMATDMALGTNWSWFVSGGVMQGSGASHWHKISLSSVRPGDIVTAGEHVEFVDGGSGAYPHIATFGAHSTGQRDGYQSPGHTFVYTTAYRYE